MDYVTIKTINMSIELTGFSVAVALLTGMLITRSYRTKTSRILLCSLVVHSVLLLLDSISWGLGGRPEAYVRPLEYGINFLVYGLSYSYNYLLTAFVTAYISYKRPGLNKTLLYISAAVTVGMILLTVVSQFTGLLFYFDENNTFQAGPLNDLSIGVMLFIAGANAVMAVRNRKYLDVRDIAMLLAYLLIPMACAVAEAVFENIMLIYAGCTVSFVLLYVSLQIRQEMDAMKRENEMKTAIMLTQIQPHFLYNALCAIQDLCHGRAPEAEQATVEFSEYLRANLESLSAARPIAFEQELRHVRNYLSLEQKRFKEDLRVEYDIGPTLFRLPALTLQPIVENAVRYGIMQRECGGTVRISTAEKDGNYIVTVKDDGVGFDVNTPKADGRTHIGIDNVRSRLAQMCGGTLVIDSVPGVGTTAVLTIPNGEG
ncbi:MAG: histidine kinase [Syntrophomonadaceae bacterium]|nr:histidine kinase [Syntrophomonadaceae bacterium]